MKITLVLVACASFLLTVSGSPVANAGSNSSRIAYASRWAAELQALSLAEAAGLAPKGRRGTAPAHREDIARLESQWAERATAEEGFPHLPNDVSRDQRPLVETSRPQSGYISVHRGNSHGPFLGFLATNKVFETRTDAIAYSIAEPESSVTHINVVDSSLQMCVAAGPFGEFIGPSTKAFHLPRHAPGGNEKGPRWSPELNTFILTSAFSLNPDSKEITVHWVNPDGDSPPTTIALADERVFYTGDVSAFEEVVGGSDVEVVAFNWVEMRAD
ncbi:hypothetical protein B0H14DRAFT_3874609 [Mycena olivaceomarginata]|nr:hypothetical protein B0H14DRAFT_2913029 [Mycena olivaceomarginata]KAJ7825133.1 hypothetical protein B0H14DRAFT_3874609 [Mycena olivaceomarginata]